PRQFGDIGYMAHLEDPEGFSIELLQHRFQANHRDGDGDPAAALGGGARIGQITLRVKDLEAALSFYRDRLGMTLLSIQPVTDYGFTLYFLAFTEELPPASDLEAVGNREWLWQRPYTTLELQHVHGTASPFALPSEGHSGFAGIAISGADEPNARLLDDGGGLVELRP
ncbi:MAG: VOC family protein, partial [Pseudomonadota bacterium]